MTLLLVLLAVLAVIAVGAGVVLVLIKLGVVVHYAGKEEPPDPGNYELDSSRTIDE